MIYVIALAIVVVWLVVLLSSLELGRRVGQHRLAKYGPHVRHGLGHVEGAVFALLGLLLAFTFSGSATRFEAQRELGIQEANAIRTAYLRLDLLPGEVQPKVRETFGQYLDARLALYERLTRRETMESEVTRLVGLQLDIWTQAVAGSRAADNPEVMTVMLPALNDMMDVTVSRAAAIRTHDPSLILGLLVALVLICSVLAGNASAAAPRRSWIHIISFSAVLSVAVYTIADYEYWWLGLIRVDAADRMLAQLRKTIP
jgi:hypothetical protein